MTLQSMLKQAKQGATLLAKALSNKEPSTDTQGFTDIGDIPADMTQFKPQASDTARTSQTSTPPTRARPPSTSRTTLAGHTLVR